MKKIVDDSILDIVPFTYGFVYAKKEVDESGNARAAFYCYNAQSKKVEAVRRTGYLHTKFGDNFEKIVQSVPNFIFCDAVQLQNGQSIVLTSESRMHVFDSDGNTQWEENLCYRDSLVKGLASDDDCIWFVVPEKNSIVRFSPTSQKVYTRIGGNETTTFDDPVGVTKSGPFLYISCGNSKKIRKIDMQTYSIKDYRVFDEPVLKFFRILGKEYALLKSGFYML